MLRHLLEGVLVVAGGLAFFLASYTAVNRATNGVQKEWLPFGLNAGASVVRLDNVGGILKQDRTETTKGKKPETQYGVHLIVNGVTISEFFADPETRDKRFQFVSDVLGTTK